MQKSPSISNHFYKLTQGTFKNRRVDYLLNIALLFVSALILVSFDSCNSGSKPGISSDSSQNVSRFGPPPVLDSTYIIGYMKSEPKFSKQLYWARIFYRERGFKLGWFKNHELLPQAKEMLAVIKQSDADALNPADYQIKNFDELFLALDDAEKDSATFRALEKEIDVALSGTYFVWASDYYRGRVNPIENKGLEWDVKKNKIKLHKALMTVLTERESKYPYADFKPLHPEYERLKNALAKYRSIKAKGGWPALPAGTKLKPGDKSPVIAGLYKRLSYTSKINRTDTGNVYDDGMAAAVKQFQVQHGLKPDGQIGGETLRLLNVPVDQRIRQIIINMERWRWIPKSFEPDYLLANIPEYKLHVIEKGREVMNMNVIVGKTVNATKVFSDKLEYVVLSPYWNVPVSIIQEELVPKLLNNPNYLERLDMEVVDNKGQAVSTSSVDWSSVTDDFKYIVRRRPGPKNDLGDVKFMFPNQNNIYFHDTPHDQLFSQTKRDFSHGCVRLEKPIDLAEYLLRNISGWDRSQILNTIAARKEKFIKLKQTLPVYLVYFTTWADVNGQVHFRDDIYGHDTDLAKLYFR